MHFGSMASALLLAGGSWAAAQPCVVSLDDDVPDRAIGDAGQFVWFNRFTPDSYPFELSEVWAQFGDNNVHVGDAVDIVIHADVDGDGNPGTGAEHVATYSVRILERGAYKWNKYPINPHLVLPGPGDVLIGLVNRSGREGFRDFPAQLDQTRTQRRSWVASYARGDVPDPPYYPADEQWDRIDAFGYPGNWLIRGVCAGQEPGGCGESAKLSAKCKKGGTRVLGKLKNATPRSAVTFTVDGGAPVPKTTNSKGKASGKWSGLERGPHTVAVCDLETDC
ncbi:MAG: Ig-like domain repeat protein [Phycisphaerales bacterium]|nr:MAG: Ig-like domain repeat protein [Phycisphaerales bacterium]